MQQAFQNFSANAASGGGSIYNVRNQDGSVAYQGNDYRKNQKAIAGLQKSSSANSFSGGGVPGINSVELPSWMQSNPDSSMGELLQSYAGVEGAFDPSGQVQARNDAIGYNTSAGGQAANNAATEYANRASQSGASSLGAGAVKAQAMMPVYAQNASLKTNAADVAAKAHQEGATLASQIASTIGNLRNSYLSTLTGFAQGQQGFALDKYKADQSYQLGQGQEALGYAQINAKKYQDSMTTSQQQNDQRRLAAMGLLGAAGPSGNYTTNSSGQVTSGQDSYDKLKNWGDSRQEAQYALRGML